MSKFWIQFSAWFLAFSFVFGFLGGLILISSIPFWLLWNWLIPPIFGLPNITLIQSFGLWLLLMLVRSTKFDFKQTMENIKSQHDNNEPIEWNQVLDSVKKNYMA
tara:strand:- start:353 stop:667 length:315 start_codon:yes stop_codon:yes gene_type:complete